MIAASMPLARQTPIAAGVSAAWTPFAASEFDAHGGTRMTATCVLHLLAAPRLCFVRRCAIGRAPSYVEDIHAIDGMQFRQWYMSSSPTAAARETALRLLRKSAQELLYIACSCRPEVSDFPPLTGTQTLNSGTGLYTAKRLTERTPHAWFCFQHFDTASHAAPGDPDAHPKMPPDLLNGHLVGAPARKRDPTPGPMATRTSNHSEARTTVYTALMHLLTSAGRHKIDAVRTYADEVSAVAQAAKAMLHRKAESLSVWDCLLINPPDPTDKSLLTDLFARSAGKWPKRQLPVGWVLVLAYGLEKHADGQCTLKVQRLVGWKRSPGKRSQPILKTTSVNFGCPVRVAEVKGICVRAPYLVCLRAELSAERKPLWIEGFAQPVQSRDCWVPIPSGSEREAVGVMRGVAAECDAAGINHDMEKKVGVMKSEDGETCEPDFVARKAMSEKQASPLLVETQKTKSAAYEAAKVKPHRIMEEIGRLYVDDRQKYSRAVADERLRRRLRKFYGLEADDSSNAENDGSKG